MKNLMPNERIMVFIVGDEYMVVAAPDITEEEFVEAVMAAEELQRYREMAVWN